MSLKLVSCVNALKQGCNFISCPCLSGNSASGIRYSIPSPNSVSTNAFYCNFLKKEGKSVLQHILSNFIFEKNLNC